MKSKHGYKPPSSDTVRYCAAFHTRRAARSLTRAYDEALRPFGIRSTQLTLLNIIQYAAPESMSGLADWLAMERSTLVRNLRLLEKDGLIEVGQEGYRRTRSLRITPAGEAVVRNAMPHWLKIQKRVEASVGAERWQQLCDSLDELADIL